MNVFNIVSFEVYSDRAKIIGRCYKGVFCVGEDITHIIKLQSNSIINIEEFFECCFSIEKIIAYNKELPFVDEGLTAQIWIKGINYSLLKTGWNLASKINL